MGIPASGAEANFDFSILLRLAEGKIAERWATADDVMGLLVPLGFKLVPPK
jgi:predicted ester cyclase